jgi:hypothetical protein
MVALALLAMLWGNCLSCPEIMAGHQPAHSCCHKPQPASTSCHTQGLQHFVNAETPAPVVPHVAVLAEIPAPPVLADRRTPAPLVNMRTPPGESNAPLALRI